MYNFLSTKIFSTYNSKLKNNEVNDTKESKSPVKSNNILNLQQIPQMTPENKEIVADMVAATAQASLYTITGYPFDLVKARLQTGLYNSSWSCLKGTVKNEGFFGLYRGAVMPWLSHTLKRPIQYPASEYLKRYTTTESQSKNTCLNYLIGGATGIISPILGTPLQVVKISMQTSIPKSIPMYDLKSTIVLDNGNKNSFEYIKYNYKKNGIRGFYRGLVPTIIKDTVFGASFLGTYYTLRDINGHDTLYKNFFNGATAHCTTWLCFIPIDYVKTTIQKSDNPMKISDVVTKTYKLHGIREFWKGVIPACVRTIPMSGIAMLGYEWVRSLIMNMDI
jgi:solute carrier family 25 (mitochondrial carnitine/acylcarnitine transporter), member 20/29